MRFTLVALALALAAAANPTYTDPKYCQCPKDKYWDKGTNINQGYTYFKCAYPRAVCVWSGLDGSLQSKDPKCPPSITNYTGDNFKCPRNKWGDKGKFVGKGDPWYQCAYPHGACTWKTSGELLNKKQDNCREYSPCRRHRD